MRRSERHAHGKCVYEIQTMLKRKRDWVHLGSPEALHGNTETETHLYAYKCTHSLTGSTCLIPDILSE